MGGLHLDLRGDVREIARARRAVTEFLAGSPHDVIEVAQLLTSELVTNAVEYADSGIRVSFDCVDGVLRVRVKDGSPRQPVVGEDQDQDGERGRGLLLVKTLAMSWGSAPDLATGGKTVWFRLRTD